jgi:hypothetical protein
LAPLQPAFGARHELDFLIGICSISGIAAGGVRCLTSEDKMYRNALKKWHFQYVTQNLRRGYIGEKSIG